MKQEVQRGIAGEARDIDDTAIVSDQEEANETMSTSTNEENRNKDHVCPIEADDESESHDSTLEALDEDHVVDEDVAINETAADDENTLNEDVPTYISNNKSNEATEGVTGHNYNLRQQGEAPLSHRFVNKMDETLNTKTYGVNLVQIDTNMDTNMITNVVGDITPGCRDNSSINVHAIKNMHIDINETFNEVCNFMFTQMTADQGIKQYGELAVAALMKEFAQLDDMNVFVRVDHTTLTDEQKSEALTLINLIKEKRCGKIKGRTVADGRKQRAIYSKEEITSPTVSTDALLMSLVIDAIEKRFVANGDVPGAYLQTFMPDFVLVKVTGKSVDVLCETNPQYKEDIVYEYGKAVIYLRLNKALYGCLKSAMLWYNLFSETLEGLGFIINPYDQCVANKVIDGRQCTIAWYVDDLKISHVSELVVKKFYNILKTQLRDN